MAIFFGNIKRELYRHGDAHTWIENVTFEAIAVNPWIEK
jgi:hypothetical protein